MKHHAADIEEASQSHPSPAHRKSSSRSVVEQLEELMAALALNKPLLARILRVDHCTTDEWFAGKQPKQDDKERLQRVLGLLAQASAATSNPLNARFVRRPHTGQHASVVDLLSDECIDMRRAVAAMENARSLTDNDRQRRGDREIRLRDLGFEQSGREQRRETLAANVALLDWPK